MFCQHTEPNFSMPWQRLRQYSSYSSGFAVRTGKRNRRWILTNAHSVEYNSQVRSAPCAASAFVQLCCGSCTADCEARTHIARTHHSAVSRWSTDSM